MSYKDLVVHIDDSSHCEARVAVAAELAGRFQAHLTGIAVDPGLSYPAMADVPVSPELVERLEEDRQAHLATAEELFRKVTEAAGVQGEWRVDQGEIVSRIALHVRHSDSAIVGQEGADGDGKVVLGGLPDALVMTCGRPVLVVPYIGTSTPPGRRIMVAWDGSREAVRAVNDALPLLIGADQVEVMSIDAKRSTGAPDRIPGADLCLHLARHGAKAQAQHVVANDIDVGDLLLSRVADTGSDMLVMGAYGHSRWREIVLGGATRQVLEEMTVPVLMSH